MRQQNPPSASESGYIELLTSEASGTVFGCRLVGAKPGPQVVIAGMCPLAEKVFDRLLSIPTLPWMNGNLVLIKLDALENLEQDISSLKPLGIIDHTIILPCGEDEAAESRLVRRSYHMVLRTCTEFGMIAGRGVSNSV